MLKTALYKDHYCFLLNCGEIAEGGGDFTVVVISFVVTVLVVVDSVTIGSAKAGHTDDCKC